MKKREYFSEKDDQFIIDNQETMTPREMGVVLGRDETTIAGRRKKLHKKGLILEIKRWATPVSDEEKEFLKVNIWTLGAKECARKLGRPYGTVYITAKKMGLPFNPDLNFTNRQDISNFTTCLDPFVVYFLGLMWADGNISKSPKHRIKLKIKTSDFDYIRRHLSRVGNFWNEHEYTDSRHPHWSKMTVFETTHRDLWRFFESQDYLIKSGGSADKILSHIPEHLRHYWWRGYFDGDGCISNRRLCFNSGLDQDWGFVENLGKQLNISFDIERKDRGSRAGSKTIVGRWHFIKKTIDFLYQGEQFGFDRKRDKCFDYLKTYLEPRKGDGNTSQYRGVCWSKHTKDYLMQISHGDKKVVKRFGDEVSAAKAYDLLAAEWFGNKAILNFT